jgi:hypothetical protein
MSRSSAGSKGFKRTDPSGLQDEGIKFLKMLRNIIPVT